MSNHASGSCHLPETYALTDYFNNYCKGNLIVRNISPSLFLFVGPLGICHETIMSILVLQSS